MNNIDILNNLYFKQFLELRNKNNWSQLLLYKKLEKFLFSHNFSKDQIFDIFEYFKFSRIEALSFLMKKFSLNYKKRLFNFKKYKNCFTIFVFFFDFLYQNDIIDFYLKLSTNSSVYDYYDFLPKIKILKGWSKYQLLDLMSYSNTPVLSYHVRRFENQPFFVKIGVFSLESKALILKLINIKNNYRFFALDLEELILQIRLKTNLSFNHIFDILSTNIIVLIDLDLNLFWDSSKESIVLNFYENCDDDNIKKLNVVSKKYYKEFYENDSLYTEAFEAFLRRNCPEFDEKPKKSLSKDIYNLLYSKLKEYVDVTTFKKSDPFDLFLKENYDTISSINSPNKENIFFLPYYFSFQNKMIFFKKVISEYSSIIYNNKKLHLNYYKSELKNPNSLHFLPTYIEEIEAEDKILFPNIEDLPNLDDVPSFNTKLYRTFKQEQISICEKKINNLYKDDYSIFAQFIISDSFEYLNYFYNILSQNDFTSKDVCDLINFFKYKNSK